MKIVLFILCVCILSTQAIPVSRVANGEIAANAQHVCMVLVFRREMETGFAVLGSGSIISRRHVLTAAHVAYGEGNEFRINFFVGTFRRTFESKFALIHETYDDEAKDFANDIALIFLQGNDYFSEMNIIPISRPNVETGVVATVAGFGFTSPQAIGIAANNAMSTSQTVAYTCIFDDGFEAATSHFCALDNANRGIVCPGDNGK